MITTCYGRGGYFVLKCVKAVSYTHLGYFVLKCVKGFFFLNNAGMNERMSKAGLCLFMFQMCIRDRGHSFDFYLDVSEVK